MIEATDVPQQEQLEAVPVPPLEELEYYSCQRDALARLSLWSSGLALLLAMASRLPTWQVGSPVAWLIGSVNVGFVPIFGPIVIVGLYCHVLLARNRVEQLRHALTHDPRTASPFARAALGRDGASDKAASIAFDVWVLIVPLVAYGILICSYFDFVRPARDHDHLWEFAGRGEQIVDLLLGTGGWEGFRPLTPSIHDNLVRLAAASDANERAKLLSVATQMPWIYPPLQTWAYLGGWLFMAWLAWRNAVTARRWPGRGKGLKTAKSVSGETRRATDPVQARG